MDGAKLDSKTVAEHIVDFLERREIAHVFGLCGHTNISLLAALERGRTGTLGDIVATIQGEQDEIIRAPLPGVLVVQGGPGTGKTVVALHRAAYLLFEHRARLARDGVLVVGPNRAFLEYISNVLPSLGEKAVRQCTALDLCIPKVEITGDDISGITVHIAARVGALAGPSEVLVTRTVKDLVVGSDLAFQDRGVHSLKGIEEAWHLYAVTPPGG